MGAGATLPRSATSQNSASLAPKSTSAVRPANNMACKKCSTSLTIFSRQKCGECASYFCSKCMESNVSRFKNCPKLCRKCYQLLSGNFLRDDLTSYSVKELRQFLSRRDVDTSNCFEKDDLVELVLQTGAIPSQHNDIEHSQHLQRLRENVRNDPQRVNTTEPSASPRPSAQSTASRPLNREPEPSSQLHREPRTGGSASDNSQTARKMPERPSFPPPSYAEVVERGIGTAGSQSSTSTPSERNPSVGGSTPSCDDSRSNARPSSQIYNSTPDDRHQPPSGERRYNGEYLRDDHNPESGELNNDGRRNDGRENGDAAGQGSAMDEDTVMEADSDTSTGDADGRDRTEYGDHRTGAFSSEHNHSSYPQGNIVDGDPHNSDQATWAAGGDDERFKPTGNSAGRDQVRQNEGRVGEDGGRVKLSEISCRDDIEGLSVKQLKDLLACHFVDYKGCCEKAELVERVCRLWKDFRNNEKMFEKEEGVDDDICRVCMDAVIDCILLECGHMVTCTQCGKRMAECPICRVFVSRVVHVFRA